MDGNAGVAGRDPAVELIEQLAPRAWPPEFRENLGGWLLRGSPGEPTRRANSALPNDDDGTMAVAAKIDAVEAYYGGTGHQVRFQVTPLAAPCGLDQLLDRRGYVMEAPTLVLTADLADHNRHRSLAHSFPTVLRDRVDDDWLATLYGDRPGTVADQSRRRLFDRIEPATVFARVLAEGRSAGVGLGVVELGWVGIYCIETVPAMRRRGAATAVMAALLGAASESGARDAYLGVLEENGPARGLYERLGFRTRYRYHYRSLPSDGIAQVIGAAGRAGRSDRIAS